MNKQAIEDLLRFARAYCAEQAPWFAPALFACKIHLSEDVTVAAIDQHANIYFNPRVVEQIDASTQKEVTLSQLGFIWVHEISHLLREHRQRAEEFNPDSRRWNIAADLEINDTEWPGLQMPTQFPGVHPSKHQLPTGRLAEWYYRQLNEEVEIELFWDEGSGVHGEPRPWEIGGGQQALGDVQREMMGRSVAQQMRQHQHWGSIPGGWQSWAEQKLKPKVDWRRQLRHRLRTAISTGLGNRMDYTYRRPSRRQAVYDPILPPSLSGDVSARLACVVDTSGSISSHQLGQAVAEVMSLLAEFQLPVTVIPCDASAYDPIRIASTKDLFQLLELPGGGGTNMIVGIETALKQQPAPDAVIVLTDGYTPYPQQAYRTPVLFALLVPEGILNPPLPPNPPWRKDSWVEIALSDLD